jgi:hypothetical protein
MRYIKDPLSIVVILSGIIIIGAAMIGSAKYAGWFYSMCGVWLILVIASVVILRRRYGRP